MSQKCEKVEKFSKFFFRVKIRSFGVEIQRNFRVWRRKNEKKGGFFFCTGPQGAGPPYGAHDLAISARGSSKMSQKCSKMSQKCEKVELFVILLYYEISKKMPAWDSGPFGARSTSWHSVSCILFVYLCACGPNCAPAASGQRPPASGEHDVGSKCHGGRGSGCMARRARCMAISAGRTTNVLYPRTQVAPSVTVDVQWGVR